MGLLDGSSPPGLTLDSLVTPPAHATRRIPGDDLDAAQLWATQILGIPV